MMRVLITGVTGFTGRHLAEHALAQRAEVFGVALDKNFPPGVTGHQGDLTQPGVAEALVADVRPDRVFHLAALVPGSGVQMAADRLLIVNGLGTLRVLEAVQRHAPAARTLVISSAAIYGSLPPERQPITEDAPINPVTAYAASKAMQDLLASQYAAGHGLSVMRARTFNQTGPGEQPGLVCATLARQVAEIEAGRRAPEISLRYLFTQRDFTDVRDVVRAYWLILERGTPGAAYNVCSGEPHSIGDVLYLLLAIAGLSGVQIVERERLLLPGDIALSLGDPTRLMTDTGWQPAIPLEQSLCDLLDEWRARVKGETL
ncbi:MAG: GDP-mannose 4,6-dehydratase [Anaerolineales bacterium]|nr:GDP-mannose 4,6-dehydratase [Anaerolineales bacterium]